LIKHDPRWEPGRRGWADEPLWVVQRFVNTRDVDLGHPGEEELTSPDVLKEFLVAHCGLSPSTSVRAPELRRAIEIREAMRALLLRNNDGRPVPDEAVTTLNDAVKRAELGARFGADARPVLEVCCGSDFNAAVGRMLAAMINSMNDHTFGRLKACPRASCNWVFYDRSKNHSGTWCSMAVCGNREKARAYRDRAKAAAR
jgi:predicted RNA-binding Zn ribbon-like protein